MWLLSKAHIPCGTAPYIVELQAMSRMAAIRSGGCSADVPGGNLWQEWFVITLYTLTWIALQLICSQPLTCYSQVYNDGLTIHLRFVSIPSFVMQGDRYISWAEETKWHTLKSTESTFNRSYLWMWRMRICYGVECWGTTICVRKSVKKKVHHMMWCNVYLSPSFTKPLRDDPLFVASAFPPKATMRAVRMALFPPATQAVCRQKNNI